MCSVVHCSDVKFRFKVGFDLRNDVDGVVYTVSGDVPFHTRTVVPD